jgi:hypothetical protein
MITLQCTNGNGDALRLNPSIDMLEQMFTLTNSQRMRAKFRHESVQSKIFFQRNRYLILHFLIAPDKALEGFLSIGRLAGFLQLYIASHLIEDGLNLACIIRYLRH